MKESQNNKAAEILHERALGLYKKTKRAVKYILSEYGQHAESSRLSRRQEKVQSSQKGDSRMNDAFETISEVQKAISSNRMNGNLETHGFGNINSAYHADSQLT